jgi:hypothetical protein
MTALRRRAFITLLGGVAAGGAGAAAGDASRWFSWRTIPGTLRGLCERNSSGSEGNRIC